MGEIKSYKDLVVYQKGYELSLRVYQVTYAFPSEEKFGLISQMRRAVVSIPCNIAEGYRRRGRKEYIQFLHVALGSCSELETLLSLSKDLKMIDPENFDALYSLQEKISKMLSSLIDSLSKGQK
ncbi:MAG: four helix bundle protein [Candidatus Manganitrophus sp. SA1]|nr:four helix bundle protein [Candidatus Manganitrophus morganii]